MHNQPLQLTFDGAHATELIAAFQRAHDRIGEALESIKFDGAVPEPWLGDPVSARVAAHFNAVAVENADSGLNVFRQYRAHRRRIIEQIQVSATEYASTDDAAESSFHRTS